MNKNIYCIIIMLFLVLINIGCTNEHIENEKPLSTKAPMVTDKTPYKIEKEKYAVQNITITYPKIIGILSNQDLINNNIKNEAFKVLKYYELEPNAILELTIDYEIKVKTDNFLSILYKGYGAITPSAHGNNILYTTNINLTDGNLYRLKDFINIDDTFVDTLKSEKSKIIFNSNLDFKEHKELEEILKENKTKINKLELIEADYLDSMENKNQNNIFSYYTNQSLGISFPVGHAAGDHYEIEINYKDIKGGLKDLFNSMKINIS